MTARGGGKGAILDAVLTVLSSRGAEELSIRNVAAAAGVSVGAVQHHFPTKEALVVGAMTEINERFRSRMRERLEREESAETRLRVFCHELACVTESGRTDAIVWTAFAARASTSASVRAIHATDWARTEEVVLALLIDAFPTADVTAEDAALVLAVTDGIAVARAAEQSDRMSPTRARALVDGVLDAIAARTRPAAH